MIFWVEKKIKRTVEKYINTKKLILKFVKIETLIMEGLTITQTSSLANTISIKAAAAVRVAGVRISKPARTLHTPSMVID